MKLKKYEAPTEEQALEQIKSELGQNALILSIKKIQPKGIKSIFAKEKVEVTVAYEADTDEKKIIHAEAKDNFDLNTFEKDFKDLKAVTETQRKIEPIVYNPTKERELSLQGSKTFSTNEKGEIYSDNSLFDTSLSKPINNEKNIKMDLKSKIEIDKDEKISKLETKLKFTEEELAKLRIELDESKDEQRKKVKKYKNPKLDAFYYALLDQKVLPEVISYLLDDITKIKDIENADLDFLVRIIYNKIIKILDNKKEKDEDFIFDDKKPKILTFIGPTGVGKTTTIAKLSSHYILNSNKKVGLLTSDTYRIAAIEQLKTYAEILNIDIKVVYDSMELVDNLIFMSRKNEIILIDTAGRSHKNNSSMEDLKDLLEYLEDSQKYLVLSLPTKYNDTMRIIETYRNLTDFDLIFTKLDETDCFGTMLNVCYKTGKRIAYLTNGQNVPDDIMKMNPEKIAKILLGIGGV